MRACAWIALVAALLAPLACREPAHVEPVTDQRVEPGSFRLGAAKVDITPLGPIRLCGYAARGTESEGVLQPLFARALAIVGDGEPAAVLVALDLVAVPRALTARVAGRLSEECGLRRERFVLAVTHTHNGPQIDGAIPNMFGAELPADQDQRIVAYTRDVLEPRILEAARAALASLAPGRLAIARGEVGFAANRRTAGGPVDHELPLLVARDESGVILALVANYACHCTTLGPETNLVCGDWAGFAAAELEARHPDAVALVTIGCGADANPQPRAGVEHARANGISLAMEIERLLGGERALQGPLEADFAEIALPFDALPTREQWAERGASDAGAFGYHARKNLARLERGETIPTELRYPVQTWRFGDDLAMVFLGGEVVVDYALRLKRELDRARIWVTAYANDVPCYIPSERILAEGGYEAEGAMIYYDQPTRLAAGVEQRIVDEVLRQIPAAFEEVLGVPLARVEGIAPKTPEDERASFRTHAGLEVELVASEPLVESPVAIDFGRDGRLWVAEMYDYPSGVAGDLAPGGRIVALEDRDGDGTFDTRSVFLEPLPFPTGVTVWRDGVLVCAAPDVLFARDTDGDGRADEVKTLLTGFATDNYQARVNCLSYGLDGWVYGASGIAGSLVTSLTQDAPIALGSRDFRFKPDTGELEPECGISQYGRVRDDWGDWFGCDNSTLVVHYPIPEHVIARNPYAEPPPTRVVTPSGEDPDRLYPISRTLERFNDVVMAERTTSACGIAIYRDDLLGPEYRGNAFTCEPVHNLVHREVLERDGATFKSHRALGEEASEFLAAEDNWFRPVQARTGPDGALWIVDMYRFVIEHPTWIPEERLAQLDVRAGADMGRIWRVVPQRVGGERVGALRPAPNFERASTDELVATIGSPNGTQRDLAQMELVWRDATSSAPALLDLFTVEPSTDMTERLMAKASPETRAQALATLGELAELDYFGLMWGLDDPDPRVRLATLRDRASLIRSGELEDQFGAAIDGFFFDEPLSPLLQSIVLGERLMGWSGWPREQLPLDRYAWNDPYVRFSMLCLALDYPAYYVTELRELGAKIPALTAIADELLAIQVRRGDVETIEAEIANIADLAAAATFDNVSLVAESLVREFDSVGRPASSLLHMTRGSAMSSVYAWARVVAVELGAPLERRARAVFLLGCEPPFIGRDLEILRTIFDGNEPPELQRRAIVALARVDDARATQVLIEAWGSLSPSQRPAALDTLAGRAASALALLDAASDKPELRSALDASRRQFLLRHGDERVRKRAAEIFAASASPDVDALLERYAGVRSVEGSAIRGRAAFERVCSSCHVLEGMGHDVGPDLAAVTDRSTKALLTAILDPNRAVNPQFVEMRVESLDGRATSGIVVEETASTIVLRRSGGEELRILRANVSSLEDTRISLMPSGLENELPLESMADLVAYLQSIGEPPRRFPGNEPRLVEADVEGVLELSAASASLHGDSIVFEAPFQNLGYWSSTSDRAEWDVVVPADGEYTVRLEYACDDGVAGNTLRIDVDDAALTWIVAGTGGWSAYREVVLGPVGLSAGRSSIVARGDGPIAGALLDLRRIKLEPGANVAPKQDER